MSFPYKNPISPNQLKGQQSLDRSKTYGTSYSTLSTGGFMEVYSLDQLYYTIPPSIYGPIEYSGNFIPITFSKGSGTTFSFDTLTLQPDNISSGRRKIGMLVYVREVDQIYQYNINNYFNLFTAATASTGTVVISDFGTTVKSNSAAGIAFINAWTANTIDGVGGITNPTAVWKKYYGNNLAITGGTFNTITSTLTLTNITGGTQNLTGFGTGSGGGSTITGGTFDKNTETLTLSSSGGSIYITGFSDVFVTGGTYNNNTITFTNNSGGTFNVTGITASASTSSTFTGGTVPGPTDFIAGLTANTFSTSYISDSSQIQSIDVDTRKLKDLSNVTSVDWDGRVLTDATPTPSLDWDNRVLKDVSGNNSVEYSTRELVNSSGVHWLNWQTGVIDTFTTIKSSTISATTYQNLPTDIRVTGATYSNNTFTYRNNTGGTFSVLFNTITGLTINGNLSVTGTTSSGTISATTYQNLPTDIRVTGGTYSNGTATFTNNTGGTFNVTGFFTSTNDVRVTGATYSNNTFTFTNSTGGTFSVLFNTLTGATINGNLSVTGTTSSGTISATTYQNLPTDIRVTGTTYSNNTFTYTNNTGGTFSVLFNTMTGLTINGNLSVTGTTSSGTISATTYQNLPTDVRVTGATYSNNTFTFTNNTGGTFNVLFNTLTGATINGNLSVTGTTSSGTISATTYQNLPTDVRVTGGTYSYGTSTFTNSTGGTFSVTGYSKYFVTAATPTGYVLINGDRWYNLNDGTELVYVNTGSGFQWIQPNTGGQFLANYLPLSGGTVSGVTNFTAGLTTNSISATTYLNLPTDIRVTGATYNNNTFTYTNNTGGTFNVLFNTITGLTTNGNLSVTGTTTLGNGTFTKAGFATGDVLLDNSGTDTPGVLFYYANNSNYGIDSWNGSYDVLSGQLLRITNKLNETGGAVKMAIDTSGNIVVGGFVKANAWRAGQVVNDIMLSNTEVTISTTTIATSTSDTDFLTYSYTPLSSTSYLVIHYHLASFSFEGGTGNDSYFSRIKVDGVEITYSRQSTVNGNRTGVLFPLTGRYTNSNTTAKSIVVACRRDSADDSITIVNTATSMWLRITEIAR